ncbi:MAG: DUF2975 domain-containing protein [Enterobacteriaceae bacterium]
MSNTLRYKYLGWCFFIDALIATPLNEILLSIASSMSNPVGERYFGVSFSSFNIMELICGVLLIMISWIMIEGHTLQNEQELTI